MITMSFKLVSAAQMAVQSSVVYGLPLLYPSAWQLRPTGLSAGSFRLLFFWLSCACLYFLKIFSFSSWLGPSSGVHSRIIWLHSVLHFPLPDLYQTTFPQFWLILQSSKLSQWCHPCNVILSSLYLKLILYYKLVTCTQISIM